MPNHELDTDWETLNKVLLSISIRVDGKAAAGHRLRSSTEFLKYLWDHHLNLEAKRVLYERMLRVEEAIGEGKGLDEAIPTAHNLLNLAREHQGTECWEIQIPLAFFSRALREVVLAALSTMTAKEWKRTIEKSNIFLRWRFIRASGQVAIVDLTYRTVAKLVERSRLKVHERGAIRDYLPTLEAYRKEAGVPMSSVEYHENLPVQVEQGNPKHPRKARSYGSRRGHQPPGPLASMYIAPTLDFNGYSQNLNPWDVQRRNSDSVNRSLVLNPAHYTAAPLIYTPTLSNATPFPSQLTVAPTPQQISWSHSSTSNNPQYSDYYLPPSQYGLNQNLQMNQSIFAPNFIDQNAVSPYSSGNQSSTHSSYGAPPYSGSFQSLPLRPSHHSSSSNSQQGYPHTSFTHPPHSGSSL